MHLHLKNYRRSIFFGKTNWCHWIINLISFGCREAASSQLILAPMNLTSKNDTIAFVDTGFWATKAMNAANQYCKIRVLDSAMSTHYDRIPKKLGIPEGCTIPAHCFKWNNRRYPVSFFPEVDVPIVCDMTSDFLSRKYQSIYLMSFSLRLQKNFGIAGITCVLIRKNKLTNRKPDFLPYISIIRLKLTIDLYITLHLPFRFMSHIFH